MSNDRPRGGRRAEDFPEARTRDDRVLSYLVNAARSHYSVRVRSTRNMIATDLDENEPRKITYALHRLRSRGLVRRVPVGNEGHGYWEATERAMGTDHDEA